MNSTPALFAAFGGPPPGGPSSFPVPCPLPFACPGYGTASHCAEGYGGPLCADCMGGRLRHPLSLACVDGPPAGSGQGMLFCLLSSAALLLVALPAAAGACGGGAGPATRALEQLGAAYVVLLSFLQSVGALSGGALGGPSPPLPEWQQFVDARAWSWWGRSADQLFPFLYVLAFLPAMLVCVDACVAAAGECGALERCSARAAPPRGGNPFSPPPPPGGGGAAATALSMAPSSPPPAGVATAAGLAGAPLEPPSCRARVGPGCRYLPSFPVRLGLVLVTPASLYTLKLASFTAPVSPLLPGFSYLLVEPSLFATAASAGAHPANLLAIGSAWLAVFFAAVCVAPGWAVVAAATAAAAPAARWGGGGDAAFARQRAEEGPLPLRAARAWAANLGAHLWLPAPLFRTVLMVMLAQFKPAGPEGVALCVGLQAAFLAVAGTRGRELRYNAPGERFAAWLHVADAFSMAATLAACLCALVRGNGTLEVLTYILTALFFAALLGVLLGALLPSAQLPPAADPVALLVWASARASSGAPPAGAPGAAPAGLPGALPPGAAEDGLGGEKGEGSALPGAAAIPRPFLPPSPSPSACCPPSCFSLSCFPCCRGGGGGGAGRGGGPFGQPQRPPQAGGLLQFFSRRPTAAQQSGRPQNGVRMPARAPQRGAQSGGMWAQANPMTSGGGFPPRR